MIRISGILYILCGTLPCAAQTATTDFSKYNLVIPNTTINYAMVPIPAGTFSMGSSAGDKNKKPDEEPQHSVKISAFWMGAYEMSRDAFDVFYLNAAISQNVAADAITRPSPQYIDFSQGMGKEGGYPVNSLSQYAALMYCRWLYSNTSIFYRLPTEAEWEYACRAGTTSPYFFGSDEKKSGEYAWYKSNSNNKYHISGEKKANPWGLYDILGNVSEWTLDHYSVDALKVLSDNSQDPRQPYNPGRYPKVLRGGSYADDAVLLRSANRIKSDPSWNRRDPQIPKSKWWLTEAAFVGFRLVRPFEQPDAAEINAFFDQYLGK